MPADKVYLTQYYDPTHLNKDHLCTSMPPLFLTAQDIQWAYQDVVSRLNQDGADAAKAAKEWNYIGGIAAGFAAHGYCTKKQSWIVSVPHTLFSQWNPAGALHPNLDGQMFIAKQVEEQLRKKLF